MTDKLIEAVNKIDKMYGGPGMPTWDQCEAFNELLRVYAHELAEEIRAAYSGDNEDSSWVFNPFDAADLIDPEVEK